MSYNDYLHRSFDYQLYGTPSRVLDWAPARAMARYVLVSAPHTAVLTHTTSHSWHTTPPQRRHDSSNSSSSAQQQQQQQQQQATQAQPQSQHDTAPSLTELPYNNNNKSSDVMAASADVATSAPAAALVVDAGEHTTATTTMPTAPVLLPPGAQANRCNDYDGSVATDATPPPPPPSPPLLLQLPQLVPATHDAVAHTATATTSAAGGGGGIDNSADTSADTNSSDSRTSSSRDAERSAHEAAMTLTHTDDASVTTATTLAAATAAVPSASGVVNAASRTSTTPAAATACASPHACVRSRAHRLVQHVRDVAARHTPRTCASELVCQSYGFATAYTTPSFALTAGLYTALGHSHTWQWQYSNDDDDDDKHSYGSGDDNNDNNKAHDERRKSGVAVRHSTRALRASQVAQVCWWWRAMRWRGTCNVRLLPLPSSSTPTSSTSSSSTTGGCGSWLPACEYAMHTPWTDWCVQRDEQVTKAAAFLTLYKTRDAPLQEQQQHEHAVTQPQQEPHACAHATSSAARSASSSLHADDVHTTPPAVASPSSSSLLSPPQHHHKHTLQAMLPHHDTDVAPTPSLPPPPPPTTTSSSRYTSRSYRLRELRVGAGVAVKNDMYSGINVYCGASTQLGRGLGASAHVDVLRRVCVALTSQLGDRVTAAVRLRVNVITFHGTALDAGVCCRPLVGCPQATLRVCTSPSGSFAGVHIDDVTHALGGRWLAATRHLDGHTLPLSPPSRAHDTTHTAPPHHADVVDEGNGGSWFSLDWSALTRPFARAWATTTTPTTATTAATATKTTATATTTTTTAPQRRHAWSPTRWSHASETTATTPPCARRASMTTTSWWSRSHAALQSTCAYARRARQTALQSATQTCRVVRRLDWLAAVLDSAHVDVSFGVMLPPDTPAGRSWRSFVVVSAH